MKEVTMGTRGQKVTGVRGKVNAAAMAIAGAGIALVCQIVLAQDAVYPNKPIKIVVPFSAGGATDLMTRNVAQKLSEDWKQPVVVENRAGGNALIGADVVAKSRADGYTYLAATITMATNATLFPNAPYKLQTDLQPVAIMGLMPLVAVVRAESPIKSLQDLLAVSKVRALNAGSSGNGSAAHLGLELFNSGTGATIQHVPYKGGALSMNDLLAGHIDVIFSLLPECLPYVKSGKLRALAVTSDRRHPLLPDVPTTSQAGIPGIEFTSWNGIMVPMGTAKDIVLEINAEVAKITALPEMKARIIELGYQPVSMSVAETENFVRSDVDRMAKVIRRAGITGD